MGSKYKCWILSVLCHSRRDEKFTQFTAQHLAYIQERKKPHDILFRDANDGLWIE